MPWPWMFVTQSVFWVMGVVLVLELINGDSIMTILTRMSVIGLVTGSLSMLIAVVLLKYLSGTTAVAQTAEKAKSPESGNSSKDKPRIAPRGTASVPAGVNSGNS